MHVCVKNFLNLTVLNGLLLFFRQQKNFHVREILKHSLAPKQNKEKEEPKHEGALYKGRSFASSGSLETETMHFYASR